MYPDIPTRFSKGDHNSFFRVKNMVTTLAAPSWRHWIISGYVLSSYTIPRANQSPVYKRLNIGGEKRKLENAKLSQAANNQPQQQEQEEDLKEKGRIALMQLETEGKRYFKPKDDVTYRLAFDRAAALEVRGQPSAMLTRKISDRNDPNKIIGEQPVLEWIYEITQISGNRQLWSVTSKKLGAKILKQLIDGKTVIDFTKTRTGPNPTDVEYTIIGVR
jgi:hypothetical protein